MSNSLEDFFNKLAGKDILKEMRDEEQAKIDAKAKLVAEQQEKAKSKWSQIEALVGAQPRLEEVAKDLIDQLKGTPNDLLMSFSVINLKEPSEKIKE